MFAQANNIKAGNTVQMGLGGEIVEILVRTIKTTKAGLIVINNAITIAADKSVFICYQLVNRAAFSLATHNVVVKLANGMFWRGNTAAPVKGKASASILSRAEALELQANNRGATIHDAPKSRH